MTRCKNFVIADESLSTNARNYAKSKHPTCEFVLLQKFDLGGIIEGETTGYIGFLVLLGWAVLVGLVWISQYEVFGKKQAF